jgi:hypothetical protein
MYQIILGGQTVLFCLWSREDWSDLVSALGQRGTQSEPRSERSALPRSARPHVVWLIFVSLFFSVLYLASSIPPRVRQQTFKLATQDGLRVPITVLPVLTASPLHFPLFYVSRLALPDNIQPTQATTTQQLYARSFTLFYFSLYVLPLSSFILHRRHLRGPRYYTNRSHN